MSLKDAVAGMYNTLCGSAQAGESVVYTPRVGAAVTVPNAVWIESAPRMEQNDGGQSDVRSERVVILAANLATVERRASVLRSLTGETWTVDDARSRQGVAWEITVTRQVVREQTAGKVLDR